MSGLRVIPIVEGHGDERAVPELLRRIGHELLDGQYIDVLRPIRVQRSRFLKGPADAASGELGGPDLRRAVKLAARKLSGICEPARPELILILLDANSDCPKDLAPAIERAAHVSVGHVDVSCVLPNPEYETWFVAAAESLDRYLRLAPGEPPETPEKTGSRKAWISSRFRGVRYSETVDQVRLTATMDLSLCRRRSPSFDKLCREIERRCR